MLICKISRGGGRGGIYNYCNCHVKQVRSVASWQNSCLQYCGDACIFPDLHFSHSLTCLENNVQI